MKTERVIGRIPVLECLLAGKRRAHRLFLQGGVKGLDEIRKAAQGLPIDTRTRRDLDALAEGALHQGVILEANPLPVLKDSEWLARPCPDHAVVVVLDGIEDPHNFGAIVRSAAACDAAAVVFTKDRSAPLSPVAVKSAAGGMEHIDLVRATNLVRCLEGLKEAGFWSVGLDAEADRTIWETNLKGRIALVIGGEGKGLRRLVREHCDFHARIPLTGPITALNASVSAAIALVECSRQRQGKG